MTNTKQKFTYKEMLEKVSKAAGAMANLGVKKGDRVLIYMPMIPEALIAMQACARLGAVHSVVFGGFGAPELAVRINHAQPKLIIAGSCGIEPKTTLNYQTLVNKALDIAEHKPDKVIYKQREALPAVLKPGRDLDWDEVCDAARPHDPVEVNSTDPLYILYTSGTTGAPKGVVRDNGGYATALTWSMKNIYDQHPGDVFWAASDVGWVVGHSYICYGPMMSGISSVMFEGKPVGTPDAGEWWRMIDEYKVTGLFTSPTAIRAIYREDPNGEWFNKSDLSSLRGLYPAGEHLDPATEKFIEKFINVPIMDNYWQTETGWPIVANPLGIQPFPNKYGSACKSVPGWDLRVLDDNGNEVGPLERGELAVKLPLPPGAMTGLFLGEDRYQKAYMKRYPGYYQTGDAGYKDEEGYVFIMARTDDVINVAGHRLSTGAIEEVLNAHPAVSESAVFGVKDELKGQVPLGMILIKKNVDPKDFKKIEDECVKLVRHHIGPVAFFKTCKVINKLPKTRSGKILRGTMQKMADGEKVPMPATIDDPDALKDVEITLKEVGLKNVTTPTPSA
eukprot:comp21135_c0_seq1/m.28583 comp21135_c0_seq1/g.28583  ORF comp21135_c0_seq1/g.28583 comp21135_c0_seq1/m.28583 type:complete len:562 (-) comp21135_c0_seq1:561-2246(-)